MEKYEIESSRMGFHVEDPTINQFRLNLINGKWNAQELLTDHFMAKDPEQFKELPESERNYLAGILVFFAAGDDCIFEFIMQNVIPRIKSRDWIGYEIQKLSNEEIHSETYALLINKIAPDISSVITSIDKFKDTIAKKKLDWCRVNVSLNRPLCNVVFSLLILEALFFSSSFAAIFWFRSRNLLLGVANSNTMIANDEGEHNRAYFYIYGTLNKKLNQEEAKIIMMEAVDIETEFVDGITPVMLGMNPTIMGQYVKFVADDIMKKAGYEAIYGVENPLKFMNEFGLVRKVDNFKFKNVEYQKFVSETFIPGPIPKFWN